MAKEMVEVISYTGKENLEGFLRKHLEAGIIDFHIRAEVNERLGLKFYIHPTNTGGDTMDFVVDKNQLGVYKGNVILDENNPGHIDNL